MSVDPNDKNDPVEPPPSEPPQEEERRYIRLRPDPSAEEAPAAAPPAPADDDEGSFEFEQNPRTQMLDLKDVEVVDNLTPVPPRAATVRSMATPPPAHHAPPPPPPPAARLPRLPTLTASSPPPPEEPRHEEAMIAIPIPREPSGGVIASSAPPPALAPIHEEPPPVEEEEPPGPTVADEAIAEARSDDWKRRAAELKAELEAETDKARAALLAYELGEMTERRLRDEPGAVKSFGRALQLDPSLRPNLWAIRRVFYRRSLWPNLLKLIDAEARFARDDRERADLYVEKGTILDDKVGDRNAARDAFDKALALDPKHRSALLARERLAIAERDEATLARVWRLAADAATAPGRKATYLVDLARLLGKNDVAAGLAVLGEAVALAGQPGVDSALLALERERLALESSDAPAILDALEARVALLVEQFGPAGPAAPHDVALDAPLDRAGRLRQEIVALRRRQAQVARATGDPERAWKYLENASALSPQEPILSFDLADLAEDAGKHEELAGIVSRLIAIEPEAGRRLALALRRADALQRAGHDADAEAVLDAVVAEAPGYLPVIELRERQAAAQGDWKRLAQIRLAEGTAARLGTAFGPGGGAADPAWAAASYVAAGDIYELRLSQPEEARQAYAQALEARPGYPPAVEALLAGHISAGRLDEAIALLEQALVGEAGEGSPRAEDLLERLAGLYEAQGRLDEAIAALVRLASRRGDDLTLRFRLEQLYARTGKHTERADLLLGLVEKIDDPARKAAMLAEVGRIHDELDAAEAAIDAYRAALGIDPEDRITRGALLALLRRTGRWEELVTELRADAEVAEGASGAGALRSAGAILERRLGRPVDAAAVYRELVDRVPGDAAALRSLASALAATPADAVDVMEREAGALLESAPGAAAGQALVRLGEAYEALGRDEDAAATFRRAAEQPGVGVHPEWALVELAARRREPAMLTEALGGLVDKTSDDAVRNDLVEEIAWLAADDLAAAAERFDELVKRAPDRRGAQLGRALIAAKRKDAREAAAALAAQADKTSDTQVAAALLLRAATLSEVAGGASEPGGLAARALALVPDDPGALVATLERAESGEDPTARAELLARRAALSQDRDARLDFALERAHGLAGAGRLKDAGRVLAEVLAEAPEHLGALHLLAAIARRAGDNETEARAQLALGRALSDPHSSAGALAGAARLLQEKLGKPAEAGILWRRVFELDPENATAYAHAHEKLSGDEDLRALHALLSKRIASLGTSPKGGGREVMTARLERAGLARRRGDDRAAADDLSAVLAIDAQHADALSQLADVRVAQQDLQAAADLLRRYNEATGEPQQRADGEQRLAGVLEKLGDREGAIESLDIVLTVHPDDPGPRERLVALLDATGDHVRAADEQEKLAQRREDPETRAADELVAARAWRDKVQDPERARRALERAQKADPLHLEVLRELAELDDGMARATRLGDACRDVWALLPERAADIRVFHALDTIAELAGDHGLAFAASGALTALLGAGTPAELRSVHAARRYEQMARPLVFARAVLDDDWRQRIYHPGFVGPMAELWTAIAESVAKTGDVEPQVFGFVRADRVAAKLVGKQAPVVDVCARALGVGEIDLYISQQKHGVARVVALETPLVLIGSDVAKGETLEARYALGKALAAARLRTGGLDDLSDNDVLLFVAGAVRAAGGDPARIAWLAAAPRAQVDERARVLAKYLSRKDKRALTGAVEKLGQAGGPRAGSAGRGGVAECDAQLMLDLHVWHVAARATLRRAGLLLGGDVALAAGRQPQNDPVGLDLVAWGASETHMNLRKELGL